MKKANFILSVIGFLSIVGAALAFKAQHRFSGAYFCYTTVGHITPNFQIIYTPIPGVRYSTAHAEKTLLCALPVQNIVYELVRVNLDE
ncbi:hypothetical protein SAMN05661012_04665 [Chitinophaga sancti]|uniref:Uncharacterized protein n=1 Tax=Chitinophaga sancti TaxID=1004 RepID=A0A1K1S3C9_9BACT|nr:hypothetical protein SAMN05661012_04665 [Chitinophaga sancti]